MKNKKEQDDPGSYPGSSEGSDPSDNLVVVLVGVADWVIRTKALLAMSDDQL